MKLKQLLIYTIALSFLSYSCSKDKSTASTPKETKEELHLNEDVALFSLDGGTTWGATDSATGKELLPPKYAYIELADEGYFILALKDSATSNLLYGLSDLKGEMILQCENKDVIVDNDVIKVKREKSELPTEYTSIKMLGDSFLLLSMHDPKTKETTYGLADINGKIILESDNVDISFDKNDKEYISIKRIPQQIDEKKEVRNNLKKIKVERDKLKKERLEREREDREKEIAKTIETKTKGYESTKQKAIKNVQAQAKDADTTAAAEPGGTTTIIIEDKPKPPAVNPDNNKLSVSLSDIKDQNKDKPSESIDLKYVPRKKEPENKEPEKKPDTQPSYPGGEKSLSAFLSKHLRYPTLSQANGIQGKVTVQIVVEKDGMISDATITQSLDKYCDQEALRVIKLMPKWRPGTKEGEIAPAFATIPVTFKLGGR